MSKENGNTVIRWERAESALFGEKATVCSATVTKKQCMCCTRVFSRRFFQFAAPPCCRDLISLVLIGDPPSFEFELNWIRLFTLLHLVLNIFIILHPVMSHTVKNMANRLRIAVGQINASPHLEENFKSCVALMQKAAEKKADVYFAL